MSEYTPTTEEVREDFAFPWDPEQVGDRPARVAAFDRWLAQVEAAAWDEGYEAGEQDVESTAEEVLIFYRTPNPHREGN